MSVPQVLLFPTPPQETMSMVQSRATFPNHKIKKSTQVIIIIDILDSITKVEKVCGGSGMCVRAMIVGW